MGIISRQLVSIGIVCAFFAVRAARSDVVVISNRSPEKIGFMISAGDEPGDSYSLAATHAVAVPTVGGVVIGFASGDRQIRYRLDPNCAYYFDTTSDSRLELRKIPLGESENTAQGTGLVVGKKRRALGRVTVKILVDEEERSSQVIWEERLRDRVAAASEILQRECRLRLEIVAVAQWQSDDKIRDFAESLDEFQREVDVRPAMLAIGFTSQYAIPKTPSQIGLMRGPLQTHILIRERSRTASEAERLEALVHELGHFLGAVDSSHPRSVMRAALVDGKARRANFRIGFDPPNLLVVNLIAEELRLRDVGGLASLSMPTKLRLYEIYTRGKKPDKNRVASQTKPTPPESSPTGKSPGSATESSKPADQSQVISARERAWAKADQQKLQGRWRAVSARRDGAAFKVPIGFQGIFSGDRVTVHAKDFGTFKFTYSLLPPVIGKRDPQGVYRAFDMTLEVNGKKVTSKGIYKIEGDTLTACSATPGDPRPTSFTTGKDDGQAVLVFKRTE